MSDQFEQFIDNIVTWMALSTPGDRHARRVPLMSFSGAYPIVKGAGALDVATDYQVLIPVDAQPSDLDTPLDQAALSNVDELSAAEGGWALNRVREVSLKSVRGRISSGYGGRIFEMRLALLKGGQYLAASVNYFTRARGKWFWVGPQTIGGCGDSRADYRLRAGREERDEPVINRFRLGCGLQFVRELSWTVELGYVGHPSLQFVTDPCGAQEAFRLRDIPEGASRRAALRHWVRQHWRRTGRVGDRSATNVRTHLRGAERFVWNGLRCTITPSRGDLKRAAA